MKNGKNLTKKVAAIATSTLAVGAISLDANATDIFEINDLGSGSELRSNILELNGGTSTLLDNAEVELKCGEGKCGEGKCGESKDGKKKEAEKKDSKSKDAKSEETKKGKDDKSKEAKCGEGKCGEGKCGEH